MDMLKLKRIQWQRWSRYVWLAIFALFAMGMVPSEARAQSSKEYKLKLAFLYNFTKYVTFPAEAFKTDQSAFVIGIVGTDPFGANLDRLAKKRPAQGRRIEVLRLLTTDDFSSCHILFIAKSISLIETDKIISASESFPTLIVGNDEGIAIRGGVINFYLKSNETLGMEINPKAARKRLLTINAKLLSLARIVETQ
jgi:hypothetical protein